MNSCALSVCVGDNHHTTSNQGQPPSFTVPCCLAALACVYQWQGQKGNWMQREGSRPWPSFTLALAWPTRDQIPASLDWSLTWGSHLESQLLTLPPFTFSAISAPSHCPLEQRAFPPQLLSRLRQTWLVPGPELREIPYPVSFSGLQAYVQAEKKIN